MVEMSSLARLFRIVVFPALSSPSSRILSSRSGEDFSFLVITILQSICILEGADMCHVICRVMCHVMCHVMCWCVIPEDAEESHGCGEEDKRRADQDSDLVPINKIQPYGWCWLLVQVQITVLTTISEATTVPPLPLGMKLIHYHCDDVTCHDVTCVTCPCNPVTADVSETSDGTQWLTSPGSHGESRHDTFRCVHRVNSGPSHWPVWLYLASDWSVWLCPGLLLVSAPAPGSEVTW